MRFFLSNNNLLTAYSHWLQPVNSLMGNAPGIGKKRDRGESEGIHPLSPFFPPQMDENRLPCSDISVLTLGSERLLCSNSIYPYSRLGLASA